MELKNIKAQVAELKSRTDKGFAILMYLHTRVVTSEGLDSLLNEALELEDQGDSVSYLFDESYSSIASEYYDIDIHSNHIKERFGRFGYACLYMDELGRGLVVEYH